MATVPATPDLATMANIINTVLRGQVIVKTKIFSLRSRAPDVASRGSYVVSCETCSSRTASSFEARVDISRVYLDW
jgi:hypothetical protein